MVNEWNVTEMCVGGCCMEWCDDSSCEGQKRGVQGVSKGESFFLQRYFVRCELAGGSFELSTPVEGKAE